MKTLELKNNLHKSIDNIENIHVLEKVKSIIDFIISNDKADFWDELSDDERAEINLALLESEDDENLIPQDKVMKQAKR
ncbi:MAG: hypothetical protein ABI840_03815 [bacterium]